MSDNKIYGTPFMTPIMEAADKCRKKSKVARAVSNAIPVITVRTNGERIAYRSR